MSSRRVARERVMQALYAFEMGSGDADHVMRTILQPDFSEDSETSRFASRLFLRSLDGIDDAEKLITQHTKNWELTRISLIDRLLLRMAICELLTFEDIPPKVSINEAIEVAKRYSTSKSGKFINGILDAVLISLQREGRLRKKGRGLLGMENMSTRVHS